MGSHPPYSGLQLFALCRAPRKARAGRTDDGSTPLGNSIILAHRRLSEALRRSLQPILLSSPSRYSALRREAL